MLKLVQDNQEHGYKVYHTDTVTQALIQDCHRVHDIFKQHYSGDSTWSYTEYNVFSLSAGSENFYKLYQDVIEIIKDNIHQRCYFQSWLNYHKHDEVLNWHNHMWTWHGYISIDPKDSVTEFEGYTIKNIPGNIYFGPGYRRHRVVPSSQYEGTRLTIGFDVEFTNIDTTKYKGFIPVI